MYYCAKKRCLFSRRPNLYVKEFEILSKYYAVEDIKKRNITGYGIKSVEHKE